MSLQHSPMSLLRRWRRFASRVALLAVALHAGWPLLAQAKPRVAGLVVPLCTVQGVSHSIELPSGTLPLEERAAAHHCDLCVAGASGAAALPPAASVALAVTGPDAGARGAEPATSVSVSHPPAQPRAPPAPL